MPLKLFSANFTRPADTTAYAAGDLVANNVTAGSVVPLTFDVNGSQVSQGQCVIQRARLHKSSNVPTLATFRLHLFAGTPDIASVAPTVANGDNGVLSVSSVLTGYLGFIDIDQATNSLVGAATGCAKPGAPANPIYHGGGQIYGLLQAQAAYVPTSGEVFTVVLEAASIP